MIAKCTISDEKVRVELLAADISGAELSKPLEGHDVPALKWWLILCVGASSPQALGRKLS